MSGTIEPVLDLERRLTLLTLTDVPAAEIWDATFAATGDAVTAAGLGCVQLAAPFLPTIPGTDTYVEELR